ncbi:MAG: hypothetical protein J6Y13_06095 [Treponema sp.]|nr:hypothetical protein [Treponema sp.]
MAELKAKDTTQKDMSAFFMQYVAKRNISIMTKAEWEQLYFYCTVRALTHKHLAELKTDDLYAVAKHLSLTFSQVNTLLKKSYRLELEEHEEKESAPGDLRHCSASTPYSS